jgi:hypothetical protein
MVTRTGDSQKAFLWCSTPATNQPTHVFGYFLRAVSAARLTNPVLRWRLKNLQWRKSGSYIKIG